MDNPANSVPEDCPVEVAQFRVEDQPATAEQAAVWQACQSATLFRLLTQQGLRAHLSVQGPQRWGTPSVNELGERVGARVKSKMLDVRNSYFYAAQGLTQHLPSHIHNVGVNWFPYMTLRNLCASSQPLPAWMADIIWVSGGRVPDTYVKEDIVSAQEVDRRRTERGDPVPMIMREWGH